MGGSGVDLLGPEPLCLDLLRRHEVLQRLTLVLQLLPLQLQLLLGLAGPSKDQENHPRG